MKLKKQLKNWLEDRESPFDRLLHELEQTFRNGERDERYVTMTGNNVPATKSRDTDDVVKSTLPLLCRLNEQDALPAILFNYDRRQCEQICKASLTELVISEKLQVKSGPKWQAKLAAWERWKKWTAKTAQTAQKANQKKRSKDIRNEPGESEKLSGSFKEGPALLEDDKWARFNPATPADGYHFADYTKLQPSELAEYAEELRRGKIQPWLIDALERGIGVHHAGMNRRYRQVVEILFRKTFLHVVVATGTLALGINMPCRTVVFAGDSVFLTALNYRQCAGRAGRRGFDLLSNVVFQDISRQKVCRLISSRLPSLTGHFPITTSFVLRLFVLLHDSTSSTYAVSAINSVLSQPRLHMGGKSFKDQTMHHLRFSIEYLRRQHLLDSDGAPLNFAGLVSHLYYTESSSFAFHALLKEGYFNELCAKIRTDEDETTRTLMLVMSHLFGRIPCRHIDAEFRETVVQKSSSMVFLPPLPLAASKILQEHNAQTLQTYQTYVRTFVDQHVSDDDNVLPLTGIRWGGDDIVGITSSRTPTRVRSSFVALSGADDTFTSIHDLCSSVRSGVFLEEAVIPYIPTDAESTRAPLNAWLLDFFKHGEVVTVERDNGIRRSDVWFYLNDFSLVLATIVTSLTNCIQASRDGDVSELDLQGVMDALEETPEQTFGVPPPRDDENTGKDRIGIKSNAKSKTTPTREVPTSWEDADPEAESPNNLMDTSRRTEQCVQNNGNWSMRKNGGLLNVLDVFRKVQLKFDTQFKAIWA